MRLEDALFDLLYFAAKTNPSMLPERLPLGGALLSLTVARAASNEPAGGLLPPSVARAVADLTASHEYRNVLPLTLTAPVVAPVVHAAWKVALGAFADVEAAPLIVPLSPVEHENGQLRWGRRSKGVLLQTCAFGDECDALALEGASSPLQVYLTPDEEAQWQDAGKVACGAMFCLLCIRRDAQAVALMHRSHHRDPLRQTGRAAFAVPPFTNLVNCPGGYHHSALGVVASTDTDILPANIVGVASTLKVCYDPESAADYIDQGEIVWGSNRGAARQFPPRCDKPGV